MINMKKSTAMDISSNSDPKRAVQSPAVASAEASDYTYYPRTPTSKTFITSPAIDDLYGSLLPPPPKPPQFLFVDNATPERSPCESPQSPWIRQLGSNGMHYFYNSVTGDSTYRAPQGWTAPSSINFPLIPHSTEFTRDTQSLNDPRLTTAKKKYRMEDMSKMNSLVETAHRYNVSADVLAKLRVERPISSNNNIKSHLYKYSLHERHMFDKDLLAKLAFARSKSHDATLHSMMASKHKREAACSAEIFRVLQQRMTVRNGLKSREAEEKENSQNAGRNY
ncbi:hypothetical protein PMAYCL1PPCAC_26655 [Pristionchus mayeri]|uniref:WW domain-containing protein n=1 Tax=Pristionchus mayeri TaxID=1317129 RepID=A0AAN5I9V6_9BILA|nr:hypothetical protein PMAYCL1PPCAC_26655 [Pristionchus mayeri]